ncbi:MAG: class I SAM-dependent methyltransferase [Chloroflexi bacterium]|nr:class I SAM-dependent methyltransferase [Chloroflexota bacterium]
MTDQIYCDGRHYDRLFADYGGDLPFLLAQAQRARPDDTLLELACGTGRVAIPLARAGLKVTGIDLSAGMLSEARRKAAAEGVSATWIEADMRAFDLAATFSTIILVANGLCHLLTIADFEACAACVRKHLALDGRFIIDVFVPHFGILTRDPTARFPMSAPYDDPDGRGQVVMTHSNVYDATTQINHITTYTAWPTGEEVVGEVDMRMFFPQELDALLKYNGLPVAWKFSDYQAAPFGPGATRQLTVCRTAQR